MTPPLTFLEQELQTAKMEASSLRHRLLEEIHYLRGRVDKVAAERDTALLVAADLKRQLQQAMHYAPEKQR